MKKNSVIIIIIGSGPGGASVAKEMALRGYNVSILEWGKDNPPIAGKLADPLRLFGGMANQSKAFFKSQGEPVIEILRGVTLGGSVDYSFKCNT